MSDERIISFLGSCIITLIIYSVFPRDYNVVNHSL